MEADAERIGRLASGEQQRLHFRCGGTEFCAQAELGMAVVDANAHQQVEIARSDARGAGRANDLLQLLDRIEAEGLHAMLEIGLGDRFLGLHRMHQADHRLRQGLMDQANLGDRGDVKMGDALVPQDA